MTLFSVVNLCHETTLCAFVPNTTNVEMIACFCNPNVKEQLVIIFHEYQDQSWLHDDMYVYPIVYIHRAKICTVVNLDKHIVSDRRSTPADM